MELLTPTVIAQIEVATTKAFATYGEDGINVVPVSVVVIEDGTICLYNFFMGKTVKNLRNNPRVALVCWQGLEGIQIKGEAQYETGGPRFEAAVVEMTERFPDRVLSGVIVISPMQIYDVSAEAGRAGALISGR